MATNNPMQMMLTSRDLLLSVGQKVTATIHGIKYEIAVWGWKDKEFILTDAPKTAGSCVRLASMTGVGVRYVKDGHSIFFNTRVIVSNAQPPYYMLIEFPQLLDRDNMRKHERFKLKIPISLKKKGGEPFAATMYDLSMGGALIAHAGSFNTGEVLYIDAEWKELGLVLDNQEVTVQNVRENVQGKGLSFSGVMFWINSEKNQKSLQMVTGSLTRASRS